MHIDDWDDEGGYIVTAPGAYDPAELAHAIVMRPGMHLGVDSLERARGFLLGLETALRLASDVDGGQPMKSEAEGRDTITSLEPALAAAIAQLQQIREGSRHGR